MRANAGTAGAFVDSLNLSEIIGCIAGDDTILLVVANNEQTPIVVDKLREYLN